MTGQTHKQFAVCSAFLSAIAIYELGLSEVNYYLSIPILLNTAMYGAKFPDVDHDWSNVKDKNVPNWLINKVIRATGGKHRSWQTHSLDITVLFFVLSILVPDMLHVRGILTDVNREILKILLVGFSSGWLSHMIADMLNGVGIRLTCLSTRKIAFVPKKIGKFRFNTGQEWESFVYKIVRACCIVVGAICIVYPYTGTEGLIQLVNNLKDFWGMLR